MSEMAEAVEAVNRNIRVANTLIQQAIRSIEKVDSPRDAAHVHPPKTVDAQLIADLQHSIDALEQALEGAAQTSQPEGPTASPGAAQEPSARQGGEMAEAFTEWQHERRRDSRVALALRVTWEGQHEADDASTSDISGYGCFIESTVPVAVGERRLFEVQMPTGRPIRLQGEVKYHKPMAGFGVHFISLNELEQAILGLLIDYAKGNGIKQVPSFL